MVKKLTFPTLTLLSYDDSVAELSRRNLNEVRLETGTRDENRSAPAPLRNDIIALTAENVENGITDVLACTFRGGGCWELFADRHPECTGNLENAVEILTTTLQADGAAVSPGVYAHYTPWGYAHNPGLWRYRKDGEKPILVPGTVPGEPSGTISQAVSMEEVTR